LPFGKMLKQTSLKGPLKSLKQLLLNKFGVDEDEITLNSILGNDLNLGPAEIEELILDICEKHNAEHEKVIGSLYHEDLEEVTITDLVDTLADTLKLD
jgi:hypothetical protein